MSALNSQPAQAFPAFLANSFQTSSSQSHALRSHLSRLRSANSDSAQIDLTRNNLTRNNLTRNNLTRNNLTRNNLTRNNLTRNNLTRATSPGTLAFNYYNYRVSESAGIATLQVDRTGGSDGAVTVQYQTGKRNTATPGRDFVATSGVLTFAPGETRKTITVPILADDQFESAEVTRVTLLNPSGGATIGKQAEALLTILNDDMPTESQIQQRSTSRLTVGQPGQETTFYVGYNQVATGSAVGNKDPWVASFSQGKLNWYRDDYEVTPDDGTATHLLWDDVSKQLYVSFTATGTQGAASEDYRRFATKGWLKSYTDGSPHGGGGAKVAVLARMNPATGTVTDASFLTALNGRKTNSLMVRNLSMNGSNLLVTADSAFAPRKPDKTAMTPTGAPAVSPNYRIEFTPDLSTVLRAESATYR